MQIKVVLIGAGNVAYHLGQHMHKQGIEIVQVFSRTTAKARQLSEQIGTIPYTTNLEMINPNADVYIVAVHDDAIAIVAEKLQYLGKVGKFIVHTSGVTPSTIFAPWFSRYGVFYPLQSFSINKTIDFSAVPLCIYAEKKTDKKLLLTLGKTLNCHTYTITDKQRAILHVNGVFVNNFTNYLYQIAWDICQKEGISFDLLRPLIRETAEKVMTNSPTEMQTGPAIRGDEKSINQHLEYLEAHPDYRAIYALLSKGISTK